MSHKKKIELQIEGMTCASCEVLIERKLQKIPGVKFAKVNQTTGKATVYCEQKPDLQTFQDAIAPDGYRIIAEGVSTQGVAVQTKNTKRDYLEMGAVMMLIFGLWLFLKQTNILNFNLGVTENMSYGFIFLIGLVAASSSCIAVTGGVLLSLAAKYNETYHAQTKLEKFKPHLLFNLGRVISYTVLGGALGALGSVFSISPRVTGIISIAASIFMVLMGLKTLKLFPSLSRFSLRMPKFISHKILNLEGKQSKSIPFIMGALTFFLPCGFTQSLQLYAISRGSFVDGALTMFFFSLGTLPALLSLSAISSFAKGSFQRYFLKFSGVLVLILGIWNINNGLALTGVNTAGLTSLLWGDRSSVVQAQGNVEPDAKSVDGKQIVKMKVVGYEYSPSQFTVVQGVPVEWHIDGAGAEGCGQILTMPTIGISAFLPKQGEKVITFVPKELGDIPFNCSMGMMTPGAAFHVVPNTAGIVVAAPEIALNSNDNSNGGKTCDPATTSCSAQRVKMEISNERGFYPREQTIKKDIPVEFIVDDQVDLGGCMGTMTIPEYNVAKLLQIGKNTIRFTPTHTGRVDVVCSMGAFQHTFNVIS